MFCKNCGNELSGSEKFCPNCGVVTAKGSPSSKKRWIPIACVIFAALCGVLILNFSVFASRKNAIKPFGDMVRELSRSDYSPWVASIISGDGETVYSNYVFDYLSMLEDDRYLEAAVTGYSKADSASDQARQDSLSLYICRFPVDNEAFAEASTWLVSVISGETKTALELNVFDYLSGTDDNRYLDAAITRYTSYLGQTDSSSEGFGSLFTATQPYQTSSSVTTYQPTRDEFILGSLSFYISQFPGNNAILKAVLKERAEQFISLTGEKLTNTEGIPLNQAYIALYLKYFGIEDLMIRRMDIFLESGEESVGTNGVVTTWSLSAVNDLINYFASIGKGMSQNFYSLFSIGFTKNDNIYIYIGLKVSEKIGFDDPALRDWLDKVAKRESTLTITTSDKNGTITNSEPVVFSTLAENTRSAISGKADTSFAETLNSTLKPDRWITSTKSYILQIADEWATMNRKIESQRTSRM